MTGELPHPFKTFFLRTYSETVASQSHGVLWRAVCLSSLIFFSPVLHIEISVYFSSLPRAGNKQLPFIWLTWSFGKTLERWHNCVLLSTHWGNKNLWKGIFYLAFEAPAFRRYEVIWVLRQRVLASHSKEGPQGSLTVDTIFATWKWRLSPFL